MSDRIDVLLDPIQNRLDAATDGTPVPWQAAGTGAQGGHHWFVFAQGQSIASIASKDGENDEQREPLAKFFGAAPMDQARLLAAVRAVQSLHQPCRQNLIGPYCSHCISPIDGGPELWPCRTLQGIESALGGGA